MSRIRSIHPSEWPAKSSGPWRHVYVIAEDSARPVKVGYARNAFWRLSDMQTGNFRKLHLCAVYLCADRLEAQRLEQQVHQQFDGLRILNEWFDVHAREVAAFIDGVI